MPEPSREPVYVISVAAERIGVHPQTLRTYERLGLVKPARRGGNRLYSDWDIERVRQIQRLTTDMGVNLAGVEIILHLLDQVHQLQKEIEEVRQQRLPVPILERPRRPRRSA
ncbi:MAG: helix-turn-helix transcriptional regulator [Armatimonadetes bacterium]|nr:helix-turn-helix transcriptional regulator [Armatimonadota bacterium]